MVIYFVLDKRKYDNSNYKKESNKNYSSVRFDKGFNGEYLTFSAFEKSDGYSKALVNVYLPNGDSTTEVDIIFIHQTGIYVIESKNYGGWIFGNEKNRYWTQTFETGRKEKFYNPVWQNNTHVKCLKNLLPEIEDKNFKSIIVFSERCTFKKMNTYSDGVYVTKREDLIKLMRSILECSRQAISPDEIIEIYNKLKPYSNVSDEVKKKHVDNIIELKDRT